jgi:hypothetical protein
MSAKIATWSTRRIGPLSTELLRRRGLLGSPIGFSGTARVEEGVPKAADVFLYRSQRPVHAEVLDEHARVVAFRVGPRDLVESLEPIAHQLRFAQLIHHGLFSLSGLFLSLLLHSLTSRLATERAFYATEGAS